MALVVVAKLRDDEYRILGCARRQDSAEMGLSMSLSRYFHCAPVVASLANATTRYSNLRDWESLGGSQTPISAQSRTLD